MPETSPSTGKDQDGERAGRVESSEILRPSASTLMQLPFEIRRQILLFAATDQEIHVEAHGPTMDRASWSPVFDAFEKNKFNFNQKGRNNGIWVWKFYTCYFNTNLSLVSKQIRDEILALEAETVFQDHVRTRFHSLLETVLEVRSGPQDQPFEFRWNQLRWFSIGKPLILRLSSGHVMSVPCDGWQALSLGSGTDFQIVMQHLSRHFKSLEERSKG